MHGGQLLAVLAAQSQPPSAQLYSYVYDWYYYLGIASGVATFIFIAYVLIKYRAKPGQTLSVEKTREPRDSWRGPIMVVALMGIVLIAVGAQTYIALPTYLTPPNTPGDLNVGVVAQQFSFTFNYPNDKSSFVLVVPVNTEIVLNVTSKDVNHEFGIPDFRVKTDAIPGRHNVVWIEPNSIGNYTIQCFELCGVGHATMITTLAVISQPAFAAWYNSTETS